MSAEADEVAKNNESVHSVVPSAAALASEAEERAALLAACLAITGARPSDADDLGLLPLTRLRWVVGKQTRAYKEQRLAQLGKRGANGRKGKASAARPGAALE